MPFSRDRFLAVFDAYHEAVWPAPIVAVALALVCLWLASSPRPAARSGALGILAVFWAWMGLAYHVAFFTRINPAAWVFGGLFLLQSALLLAAALARAGRSENAGDDSSTRRILGLVVVVYALAVYPLLSAVSDHPYPLAPSFGLPCPTTIFTLGVLLVISPRPPRWLLAVPMIWAIIGSFAPFAFGIWEDLGLPVAAALALSFSARSTTTTPRR